MISYNLVTLIHFVYICIRIVLVLHLYVYIILYICIYTVYINILNFIFIYLFKRPTYWENVSTCLEFKTKSELVESVIPIEFLILLGILRTICINLRLLLKTDIYYCLFSMGTQWIIFRQDAPCWLLGPDLSPVKSTWHIMTRQIRYQ